ncbi:hypothetical protein RB614_12305 [Phytohabitans sp. ZYX-F-186]|uniref:Uncharacterized protein n=1 Tax=Phytohabitans maris TaxID=3071409 RepID=A0ABU0ZE28_9ACTN|nr:hypothetical protein [Phytohabitans sp. ZYX-F-186]MDQ7905306.1 hypothetical protein [Phytohabitans sp. ZYX-F-186]
MNVVKSLTGRPSGGAGRLALILARCAALAALSALTLLGGLLPLATG